MIKAILKADILTGTEGQDNMFGLGGNGNDTLEGGTGGDTFIGGLGADTFVYLSVTDAKPSFLTERIDDFTKGQDKISLFAIDPVKSDTTTHHFDFTGTSHLFFSEGTIWLDESADSTMVNIDVDGGAADMQIFLIGVTGLTASDFIL